MVFGIDYKTIDPDNVPRIDPKTTRREAAALFCSKENGPLGRP
jgi:hypothetical protein